jgi:hypothetical protein
MPYLDILELTSPVELGKREIESFRKQLEKQRADEGKRLKREEEHLAAQVDQLRKELGTLNKRASRDSDEMKAERLKVHCRIIAVERQLQQKRVERKHGVTLAYDNKLAKLDLIQQWPAKRHEIRNLLASGRARERRYGDVEDIGVRKVGEGQEKDIKVGEDAVREMRGYGLMPPEIEDKELTRYVQGLADVIAANSDIKVPVRVTILESEEINAFALPGGFLYINTGLIQKAENESELVGVMSHELAHVAARHGARLMKRATIASIIYQAAQVAAVIVTGGAATAGAYYALQYGFFGLGLALDLTLLGVNREFEAEADQLGIQYAWRAGYDPRGFITFFDKMAREKGYIRSASFFRTHPPFFDRIVASFSEIEYLPAREHLKVDSTDLQNFKQQLTKIVEGRKKESKKNPKLKRIPDCPEEPQPDEEEPDDSTMPGRSRFLRNQIGSRNDPIIQRRDRGPA